MSMWGDCLEGVGMLSGMCGYALWVMLGGCNV